MDFLEEKAESGSAIRGAREADLTLQITLERGPVAILGPRKITQPGLDDLDAIAQT